ncbi:MAG: cellulase family glycosylhydrolase, partial [Actinomycetota bacterium]|nr:cellulase family glycosylhydrolase [Actinomycetota bacterium]
MPADLSRHHRCALAALLALAATCALLLTPAGALAAEKGIQTDLGWGTTAQEQEQTVLALEGTGVPWIRLDISWRQMEPTRGTYDAETLAMTDRSMRQAEQLGAGIIMAVSESPSWSSGSAELNAPPLDVQDFAHFTRDMAARYAGRVAAWEIWNEPNHPRFWQPAPNAGEYARLLQAAAPAVREGDPSTKVMFAGLAYNDYEYLEQVYAAAPDIGDSFDLMATHPYTAHGQSPAVVDRGPDGRITTTSFLGFEEVRKVMLAHGDDRPIWLTEFGWSTNSHTDLPLGGVTEEQQAEYLALAFKMLETVPYVPVAVVYNFRNNYWGGDADNWEDQLGLLRTDFSPKAAFAVFRDYQPPSAEETTPA